MNHRVVTFLEKATLFLVVAAVASGMLLGGGISRTSLGVFLLLMGAALGLSALSMAMEGRWRLTRGAGWLLLFAVGAIGVLQIAPGMAWVGEPWQTASGQEIGYVTADRSLTLQWLFSLAGGVVLVHVAATATRTAPRWAGVATSLTVILWGVGLIGFFQTLLGRPQIFGLFSPSDPRLSVLVRDVYSIDSAQGLLAYRPLEAGVSLPQAMSPFIHAYFGGFLDVMHWAACVVLMVPFVLAACLHFQHFAGVGGWRTHPRSQWALFVWIVALCMTGTAVFMADALITPIAIGVGVVVVLLVAGPAHRRRSLVFAGLFGLTLLGTMAARTLVHGLPDFGSAVDGWMSQGQAFVRALWDRPLLGSGLGTMATAWSGYRPMEVEAAPLTSSIFAFVAETGIAGVVVLALATISLLFKSLAVRSKLDADGRVVLAGSLGGLCAFVLWSAFGPGMDLPVAMSLALLLWAFAMRAVAGGYREVEEWLAP